MKKKVGLVIALSVCALLVSISSFAAGNDDKHYEFRIEAFGVNGRIASPEYRQTKYPENQWKVKMEYSEEGERTVARYWLENTAKNNVSPHVDATQGLGPYYKEAKDSASQTNVYLTAQNNNINAKSYNVSGIWDEETWDP